MASQEGGSDWPRIIDDPIDVDDPLPDQEPKPEHLQYVEKAKFEDFGNIYAPISILVRFYDLGLYPPKWALAALVERFRDHLANPDPELFARQMGIVGKTSGARNPYDEYQSLFRGDFPYVDLAILLSAFEITRTLAAEAVLARYGLQISVKRFLAKYREHYAASQLEWLEKPHPRTPAEQESIAEFLAEFPEYYQRKIRKALRKSEEQPPGKT